MHSTAKAWEHELESLHQRLGRLFRRPEPRQRSLAYLKGLLGAVERKNGWQLAEWIGESTPDGVQHLLERAQWDAYAARDVLREYVVEQLGERDAVLIVDETGFVKKGQHSVGVQRQYSGTAGRIENSQIGVFLCYAGRGGSAFIDRELYVPKAWTDDRVRCEAAGIPESVEFATKPQLARSMLERALDAGVPCGWVTGDEVYGGDRHLRLWLESRNQSFVLAVAKNEPLWWQGPDYVRADQIAESLPARAWRRLSAGAGAKGERLYDWALTPLWRLQITAEERRFGHYLLVRRSLDEKCEHAYYVVYAPRSKATRQTLVNVAGRRWEIETGFEATKGECGLDQYEVRRWHGWYRHITLSLLAHAVLVVLRVRGKKNT
ncbi:IS701 family transposase [Burkholderia cenocepacia]|uniref:IS701 family transposase n=1 Tax=Burkholderia cenocepacia TaxID=95486 RepID=UPI000F5AB283|nr:IS701 family transposase [Burkholderia cenocepacia]RQU47823.1 IS701 family transposase [Burkholderia cenocepacia]RQV31154.1 IS701 family transposase [Burkholderia cenocepacia]